MRGKTLGGEKLARGQTSLHSLQRQRGFHWSPGTSDAEGTRARGAAKAPGGGLTVGSPLPVPRYEPCSASPPPWGGERRVRRKQRRPLHLPPSRGKGPRWPAGEAAPPPALPGKPRLGGTRSRSSSSSGGSSSAGRSAGLPMARGRSARLRASRGREETDETKGLRCERAKAELENSSSRLSPSSRLGPALFPPPPRNAGAVRGSNPPPSFCASASSGSEADHPRARERQKRALAKQIILKYLSVLHLHSLSPQIHTLWGPNHLPDPGPLAQCHLCRKLRESHRNRQPTGSGAAHRGWFLWPRSLV